MDGRALLSVVDEALELADCRMVDLDATRRVPGLLPAVYLAEFDENDLGLRNFLRPGTYVPVALGRKAPRHDTTVYSFTRVEPVCRGGDPGTRPRGHRPGPFWMLARQRQFGELTGEDAGSPVQVAFVQTESASTAGSRRAAPCSPYSPEADVVEALVAGEARRARAQHTRSLAGRTGARRGSAAAVGAELLAAFPLPVTADSPRHLVRAAGLFADGLAVAAAVGAAVGRDGRGAR